MTTTDRRDATDAQFADELASLDRLDVADESAVERVARELCDTDAADSGYRWDELESMPMIRDAYRKLARAAIDALKPAPGTDTSGQAEAPSCACGGPCVHDGSLVEALREQQRVLGLADEPETECGRVHRFRPTGWACREEMLDGGRMVCGCGSAFFHHTGPGQWGCVRGCGQPTTLPVRAVAGPQRDHDEEGS